MEEIKTVIKVSQKANDTVVKIKGFTAPSDTDFDDVLSILPPLKYTQVKEVELIEEISEEVKQLESQLDQIPEGRALTNILIGLHEDNYEEQE